MDVVAPPQTQSPGTNGVGSSSFAPIDPSRVVDHLAVVLEAALGASRDELHAPESLLSKARYSDTLQRCTRFANDTQISLFVQKDLAPSPEGENGVGDTSRWTPSPLPPPAVSGWSGADDDVLLQDRPLMFTLSPSTCRPRPRRSPSSSSSSGRSLSTPTFPSRRRSRC